MTQVFSADWFTEHQAALLRLANSRPGRRLLRLHGQHSAVGSRRIIKIQPHAIHWDNGDGTLTAEFRTHDKLARCLYYGLKPLWYGVHAWDMVVANKLAPGLNLGFDSLTAYPQAGSGGVTTDGTVTRYVNTDVSFSTLASGAGNTVDVTNGVLVIELDAGSSGGLFNEIDRAIMTFDTTAISPISTVLSATLSLYGVSTYTGLGSTNLVVVGATPNRTNQLTSSDYGRLGSTSFASTTPSMSLSGYTDLALNGAGLANITKAGVSSFGLRLGWDVAGSFSGTWRSGDSTFYEVFSSDAGVSSFDPKLLVTYTGVRATTVGGALLTGGTIAAKTTHTTTVSGRLTIGASINITKQVAPVAGKQWLYRIYDQNLNYIGIWKDDVLPPDFTQQINTPGTTMQVKLPRNAFTVKGARDDLAADDGTLITTIDGYSIAVQYITRNTVGPNTDVDLNYFVDLYAYYGGFDTISTNDGQTISTDDSNDILIPIGAPLGRRIFSGWILDYAATYGDEDSLDITLSSNGSELANRIISSGTTTTVSYTNQDHGAIVSSLLAMNTGGRMTASSTIASTGATASPTFQLNTILEGITDVYNRSPAGWYWYGNVADNNVYFQKAHTTADHTFILGEHISSLTLSKSLENLKNLLYFVGGNTGSGIDLLTKFSTTSTAVNRIGLDRPSDTRITTSSEAQLVAAKLFARYKDPIYTSTLVIPSEVYDIESIQVGNTVTFRNFGNFIDGLILTVTQRHYTGYTVELQLGELLPSQSQIIANIGTVVNQEVSSTIPTSPGSSIVL